MAKNSDNKPGVKNTSGLNKVRTIYKDGKINMASDMIPSITRESFAKLWTRALRGGDVDAAYDKMIQWYNTLPNEK